ncbi:hypothetical protein V1517DRAFT_322622 [Lipomyces orientalis]|uniref:Uncharacterized protein n=1 Tax=Lipomyces orientalis TaxID=1233043 RepID=A0ACC3TRF3_9ASCO
MSIINEPTTEPTESIIDLIDETNNLPPSVAHTTSQVTAPTLKAKALNWHKDNFALTWAFINYLQEHNRARRVVLPQPGDATVGTSKLAIFKEIAIAVLREFPQYSGHLDNDAVVSSYRNAFKNRLAALLKEKATITKDIFGTGAGVSKPEDLEHLHANIWAEKREVCPYYFELVQLINNRDTVVLEGLATPGMSIDRSVFESTSDSPSSTSTDSETITQRKRKATFPTPTRGKMAQREQRMTDSIMSFLKDIMHPAISAQSIAMVKLAEIKKIEAESSLKDKELQLAKTELELAEKRAEVLRLELALLASQKNQNE